MTLIAMKIDVEPMVVSIQPTIIGISTVSSFANALATPTQRKRTLVGNSSGVYTAMTAENVTYRDTVSTKPTTMAQTCWVCAAYSRPKMAVTTNAGTMTFLRPRRSSRKALSAQPTGAPSSISVLIHSVPLRLMPFLTSSVGTQEVNVYWQTLVAPTATNATNRHRPTERNLAFLEDASTGVSSMPFASSRRTISSASS